MRGANDGKQRDKVVGFSDLRKGTSGAKEVIDADDDEAKPNLTWSVSQEVFNKVNESNHTPLAQGYRSLLTFAVEALPAYRWPATPKESK